MMTMYALSKPTPLAAVLAAMLVMTSGWVQAQGEASYEGKAVRIGKGSAHTVVRADASGKVMSIGVVFTEGMLDGLPKAEKGAAPDFSYLLVMPRKGPRTVVDHVVLNWGPIGHPPAKVYDVPHFDFHFYLSSRAEQRKVRFKSVAESGDPSQQPPSDLMAQGYILPPGTAVPMMGVHAVNPAAPEFHGEPFTATFIYGYHDKRLTFLEPMVSLSFLKSRQTFSSPISRPASYSKLGNYPSNYSVNYDPAKKVYEVTLDDLQ